MKHTAIVVTSIFEPAFLGGYVEDMLGCDDPQKVSLFIIPDRKTPRDVVKAAAAACEAGADVRCPSPEVQAAFLHKLALPEDFIPWDSDNRRNVGFLMALDAGCEVIVSIDDDNFVRSDSSFVAGHQVVGHEAADPVVVSSDGWFNICTLMDTEPADVEIFPRGFPYFARRRQRDVRRTIATRPAPVAVNAGLWLDDPDVDAVSRLAMSPRTTALRSEPVILGQDVWSPINTQNTALTREAMAAYYYVCMGYSVEGLNIDRFGDILSGYFVQKCAKHLGHAVRVGTPLADHRRTPHDLLKDLYHEVGGMVLIEDLVPWLVEERLDGSTFVEAYACLAEAIEAASAQFAGFVWDQGGRDFLVSTARAMKVWLGAARSCQG